MSHATDDNWRLEPHCCRVCFARIASRPADDGGRLYQCTNCGAEAAGRRPDALCACGTKVRKGGKHSPVYADAGIRCTINENPTPEFPSLYVAKAIGGK